ncbi:MAG: MFS transporter [bacterium]
MSARSIAVRGWAVAASVYLLGVFHRSSLGVAGLQAEQRFGISAGQLSTFVLLQLGVYALMQVPTGVLVDRFGPRRLLVVAAALMGVAQLAFAVAPSYSTALAARAVLGCGDALTFVSVLRFAAVHVSARRYPVVVAVTGMLGAIGGLGATVPLTIALHGLGWTPTFAGAATLSLAAGTLVWLVLPAPAPATVRPDDWAELRRRTGRVLGRVGTAWSRPGTRLGFWLHFACMSATTTFGVLWGFPFLVEGVGFSQGQASIALLLSVVCTFVAGPMVGAVTGRRPAWRVPLAVSVCLITLAGWVAVLAEGPTHVAPGLIIALVAFMAVGAPASSVAFSLARDYNAPGVVGTATGVVNVGGFTAAIVTSLGIGFVLDHGAGGPAGYRVAFLVVVVVQLLGTIQVLRWWLRARAAVLVAQAAGERVPVPVVRHRFDQVPAAVG